MPQSSVTPDTQVGTTRRRRGWLMTEAPSRYPGGDKTPNVRYVIGLVGEDGCGNIPPAPPHTTTYTEALPSLIIIVSTCKALM